MRDWEPGLYLLPPGNASGFRLTGPVTAIIKPVTSHALSLSLSLSLSLTHTHTHTHTLSLSLSLSHTHTLSLSLTHTHSLSLMFITINSGSVIFYLFVYCLSCLNINRVCKVLSLFVFVFCFHIIVSPCFTYSVV